MIEIITGDDIEAINSKKDDTFTTHILKDMHPKDSFRIIKRLLELWSDTTEVHRVFTYDINKIQAFYYFAKKLGKEEPALVYYHNDECEVVGKENIDKVFENLIEPIDKMFLGTL